MYMVNKIRENNSYKSNPFMIMIMNLVYINLRNLLLQCIVKKCVLRTELAALKKKSFM